MTSTPQAPKAGASTRRLVVLAIFASSLQGCGSLYAEAEQTRLCVAPTAALVVEIPGGGIVVPGLQEFQQPLDAEFPSLDFADMLPSFFLAGSDSDYDLRLVSVNAWLSSRSSLGFLKDFQVTVSPATGRPIVLAEYVRNGDVDTVVHLQAPAQPENLIAYVRNGELALRVAGSVDFTAGEQVPTDLTFFVEACFHAKVHKSLQDLIDGT